MTGRRLRPKATDVMAACRSGRCRAGQAAELNRDEYTRPAFNERADAVKLIRRGSCSADEVRGGAATGT